MLVWVFCAMLLLPMFSGYWAWAYWYGFPLCYVLFARHVALTIERHVCGSVTLPLITHAACNLVLAVVLLFV